MGTINYGTGKYITLGIKPESVSDYETDPATLQEMYFLSKEYNETVEQTIEYTIQLNLESDWENTNYILSKYDFYYFKVELQPGYYEGFYITVEDDFPLYVDSDDVEEIKKEIPQLKSMMVELADCGIISVYPGWCMGYANREETLKDIEEAIKEIEEEVNNLEVLA